MTARPQNYFTLCITFLCTLLFLTGCDTLSPNTADKPPRYAKSVQVITYVTASSTIKPDFQVFEHVADVHRPYKLLAMVQRSGRPNDQGLVMNAILWRARHLGADAAILLPPKSTGWSFNQFGGGTAEPIYSVHAILYTDK